MLVPDEITNGIVRERLLQTDCENGFLLDGFPARLHKPKHWMRMLVEMGRSIDHVVNLKVDRGLLLARLTGRRICKSCGATYHVMFNPPKQ